MSRFSKSSHAIWHLKYHLIWTPKYRYRVLRGKVKGEVDYCIRSFCSRLGIEVIELNSRLTMYTYWRRFRPSCQSARLWVI